MQRSLVTHLAAQNCLITYVTFACRLTRVLRITSNPSFDFSLPLDSATAWPYLKNIILNLVLPLDSAKTLPWYCQHSCTLPLPLYILHSRSLAWMVHRSMLISWYSQTIAVCSHKLLLHINCSLDVSSSLYGIHKVNELVAMPRSFFQAERDSHA